MPSRKSTPEVVRINPVAPQTPAALSAPIEIPLELIKPGPNPRRSWSAEKMATLEASIAEVGVLENILVRPVQRRGKTHYEVVDGLRRWTAATHLGLRSIRAEVRDMTDDEVVQYGLMQKVLSEDLNPADRADAALRILAERLQWSTDEVVSLLDRAAYERKQKNVAADNVISTQEWGEIDSFLKTVGVTPESFRRNWLPILRFPEDILTCVRDGRLEYTKAKEIARIKDAGLRQQILGEAIANDLSLRQIRTRIAESMEVRSGRSPADKSLIQRFSAASRGLPSVLQDEKKRAKAEKLLQQLEELLDS